MKSILNKLEKEVFDQTKDYLNEKVKKKAIKAAELSVLVLLGLILLSIGISELVAFYVPPLRNGYSFIFFGLLLLLTALFTDRDS